MFKFKLILLGLLILIPSFSRAAAPSRTYNYVSHTTIDPAQNNTNENNLYSYLQAGVDTYTSGSITNDAISSSAAISYSKLNLIGSIINTDISSSAAIDYSKLNLSGSIVNADINSSAAIAYSKLNLATSIVNADINGSAAIVDTKLAQITTASKVSGTAITGLASLPSGAGVIPTANLPLIGLKLISTTSVSASTASSNISITSGNTYFVQYDIYSFSANDGVSLQFNADGGGHYKYINYGNTTSAVIASSSASATQLTLGRTTDSGTGAINGSFYIKQTSPTSQVYRIWGQNYFDDATATLNAMMQNGGSWTNSANATTFLMKTTNGNNMTGTIYLYQVATS